MAACDLVITNEDDLPRLQKKAAELLEELRLREQNTAKEQNRILVGLWGPVEGNGR